MTDIIDNQNVLLIDKLNAHLAQSNQAHFAVGYFFISGLQAILPHVRHLLKLRLLIGPTTSPKTIEDLAQAHHHADYFIPEADNQQFQRRFERERVANLVEADQRAQLGVMDQTPEQETLLETLITLLREGRLEVRVYTKARLHAKAYIFDYKSTYDERGQSLAPMTSGGGIVGSSNLSLAGIKDNTELNVSVVETTAHTALLKWFNRLWEDAQPFDALLMNALQQSWLRLASPYDLYMKAAYSLVGHRLDEPTTPLSLPGTIQTQLADFQQVAVGQAIRMIDQYNGAFVADVVGLGKSYIGAAILKHYRQKDGSRALIVCPPALMAMWRTYSERYELDAHVLSMGDLSTTTAEMLLDQFPTRNFVLIDESHNFRNSNTARYRALEGFLRGRPSIRCCLLTATPRNKSARDILNQIRLFHPEDATELPIDPPNIADYFKLVEAGARPLPALLANLLVRRTRSHVLRWYGFDAQTDQPVNPSEFAPYERGERRAYVKVANKRQFFPSRRLQTVEYSIDATYNGLYKTILDALNGQTPTGHAPQDGFRYARYGLRNYIHPHMQTKEPYRSLARAGANLHGLIRVLLFKRFESSVSAFRTTLERMANQNKGFLRAVEGGLMPAGDDAQRLLNELADTEDDFSPELREASTAYDIAAFDVERLTTDLRQDIATIERLLTLIAPITPAQDAKLQRLLQLLAEPAPGGKKWLIFTQYTDTATYLHAHLNPHHRPDIAVVTGSDGANKAQIVARFSPANNPNFRPPADAQPIDTLIATDVLSEGLNMQECNRIINYDLHWNPVRLIQRFGRIDRIGTDHEVIHGYNFLPETELDRNLGLRQKLEQRIRDINDTIGEDAAILDPSEQPNTAAMYAIYEANGQEPTVLSWESEEAELALIDINELEEKLRALRQNDPEEFERIRALPDGLRSHLQRGQRGTFVMCKAGDFTQFYHADASGEPVLKEPSEALALIFSEDREPATTLPADHAQYILKAKQAFTKTYQQRLAAANTAYARSRVQKVIYERLMWQRNTQLDPDLKAQIDRLAAAFTSRKLSGELTQKLKELQLDHIELPALIAALDNLYVRYKLDQSTAKTTDTFDIPYIVCSEAIT